MKRLLELRICAKLISYFSILTIGKHSIRLGLPQIYLLQPVESLRSRGILLYDTTWMVKNLQDGSDVSL